MKFDRSPVLAATLLVAASVSAQQSTQPELKVDSTNRTLTVTATESVSVDPDLAILHIGFDTQLEDAKSAYADGALVIDGVR